MSTHPGTGNTMKIDFLRILKLVLYVISFAVIFILGYTAKKTGENTKMMVIALAILLLNFLIYLFASKIYAKSRDNDGNTTGTK